MVAGRSIHTSELRRNADVSRMRSKGSENRNHCVHLLQGDQKRKDPNTLLQEPGSVGMSREQSITDLSKIHFFSYAQLLQKPQLRIIGI